MRSSAARLRNVTWRQLGRPMTAVNSNVENTRDTVSTQAKMVTNFLP